MNIYSAINELLDYGEEKKLIEKEDRIYAQNMILRVLRLDSAEECEHTSGHDLHEILKVLLDYACGEGLIEDSVTYRDLLDTEIMGCLTPRPSQVIRKFRDYYRESPERATDYYYDLSRASNYIRTCRVKNDMKWVVSTEYGNLDITINLSKPEKDPKAIAAAAKMKASSYPKCMLCKENEGYAGRVNFPARENHRIIPVTVDNEEWFLQYSPYVYYNEHCIVFNGRHTPMKIDKSAFKKLFDVVKYLPHYFVGSNADLPIVGGSILSHEHFQGGHYEFPMAKAPVEQTVEFKGFSDVEAGIVKWPMTVIRLSSENTDRIVDLADKILTAWRGYTDEEAFIFAETDGVPHNTITPIARKKGGKFQLDLVLRNNITTAEYPDGVYHPHPEYHHIKKENIGLIEVMGLAVLPARLKGEMEELEKAILSGEDISEKENIKKHAEWAEEIKAKYGNIDKYNIDGIVKKEIGLVYAEILRQCGVYGRDEKGRKSLLKFIESI
ncbi:MAG: UDP-glucose--hexose-1-phosphate uridylyltransferase [Clostridiales bacterium]|nr:UDP-glucose--hexose-1-phosphate uridylyltransferase [Clostridiales bacterium]